MLPCSVSSHFPCCCRVRSPRERQEQPSGAAAAPSRHSDTPLEIQSGITRDDGPFQLLSTFLHYSGVFMDFQSKVRPSFTRMKKKNKCESVSCSEDRNLFEAELKQFICTTKQQLKMLALYRQPRMASWDTQLCWCRILMVSTTRWQSSPFN